VQDSVDCSSKSTGSVVSSLIIEDVALLLFVGNIWDTLGTGRLRSLDDIVVPWQPIVSVS
jgi:hypothetical protein